jgi:hypothetical protein
MSRRKRAVPTIPRANYPLQSYFDIPEYSKCLDILNFLLLDFFTSLLYITCIYHTFNWPCQIGLAKVAPSWPIECMVNAGNIEKRSKEVEKKKKKRRKRAVPTTSSSSSSRLLYFSSLYYLHLPYIQLAMSNRIGKGPQFPELITRSSHISTFLNTPNV